MQRVPNIYRKTPVPVWLVLALATACLPSLAAEQQQNAIVASDHAVALPNASAQLASAKLPITHDVYATWRNIKDSVLSRDGVWATYTLQAQEADGEVVVRHLSTGKEYRYARGSSPVFSADGKFLAFTILPRRVELDKAKKDKKKAEDAPKNALGYMNLESGKVEVIERVKQFSLPETGGQWLAVLLEPAKDDKKEDKNEDKKDDKKADLNTDFAELFVSNADAAKSLPAKSNKQKSTNPDKKKDSGTELILIDLLHATRIHVMDVGQILWNKNGSALAYTIVSKDAETKKEDSKEAVKASEREREREGVAVFLTEEGKSYPGLSGAGSYKQLSFDESGQQLAFVSNRDQIKLREADDKTEDKSNADSGVPATISYSLFHLNLNTFRHTPAQAIVSAGSTGLPAGWAPSEHASLQFSKDGQRLFLGTAPIAKAEAKDAPEAMKVDLWHWKDPELQPMQKVKAEKEKQRSYRAVYHLGTQALIQLGQLEMPEVIMNDNAEYALGLNSRPYRMLQSWDALYQDAYVVDLKTGAARLLARKLRFGAQLSPAGKYVLAFDAPASQWQAWQTAMPENAAGNENPNLKPDSKSDLQTAKPIQLTAKIKTHFENVQQDTPESHDAYGVAGWTENDAQVVLYDQFDVWSIDPKNLQAKNLTGGFGKKNQLELRYVELDKEQNKEQNKQQKFLPSMSQQGWILSASNQASHGSGYYLLKNDGSLPQALLYGERLISGLQKAKLSDQVLFTQQSFVEFPDIWSSDLQLTAPKKISDANPQQANYRWGTQQLIHYVDGNGKKQQALLARPENFDPRKKYPMMVYIYERMSDKLHQHVVPAPAQNINITRYVSNGYLVLRPDITYQTGHPGQSAMKAVVPAVQQLIAKGFVDPKRVGIQGHSWGAYQINYMITRSNMFRAVEAGASMANMISGYGGIRWGSGMSRAFQYETGQSRIGSTPWNAADKFIENSPIFKVHQVKTPYLTIHNDEDDAVPWYQAIEFFTALRRLGKEAYWFNYNGEKHGLKERDNMKHYTVHMGEFFDHYLLGNPRPEWMDSPVPYLERGKREVMEQFKPAEMKQKERDYEAELKVKKN